MASLNNFTEREKKAMLLEVLKKYDEGLTLKDINRKTGVAYQTIVRLIDNLVEDNKVRIVDFGNAKLCKVVK